MHTCVLDNKAGLIIQRGKKRGKRSIASLYTEQRHHIGGKKASWNLGNRCHWPSVKYTVVPGWTVLMQRVAASVKIWWLNGRAPPTFVDSEQRPVCFYLFIGWMWIIYQSAVLVRRIIIVCGRLERCDFVYIFFFLSRCQQPPASIRVISICLSRCGFKASSALDFDWIHKKTVSSSNLWRCWYLPCAHEGSSIKPAFFERTRSHDAFTPALMKHSCYLSSSQLWCDLILLVFLIKDQEQHPSPIYLHLPSFKVNWVPVSYQCFHDRKLEITERSAQMEGRRIARTPDFHLITAPSPCRERLPPNPDCIYAFSCLTQLQPEWISWTIGLEIVCVKVIMNT